mmetsp:Transcript_57220/g.147620  ORF Transcript_57220/g.147620 Transcript_57220/m.147620 type:complete len:229 (+) Transcript_57220:69-755(+)
MSTIVLAQVAERAGRYDDMADYMKERAEQGAPLNSEERDMFSAAFKNSLTERRQAVRMAHFAAETESQDGRSHNAELALGYKSKVVAELQQICNKVLALLQERLVPSASDAETQCFFLKMQGDYYRYLAEFSEGEARGTVAEGANRAYSAGVQAAQHLLAVHPVRLGLCLNFSVFQHEVMRDTGAAISTARTAFEQAAEELDSTDPQYRNDAVMTMQLLQDNLSLWEQ